MDNNINIVTWPGWKNVRRIGSGSFGTVYEIQREVYGDIEQAALKVISVPQNEAETEYLRISGLDDASITQTFRQQLGDIVKEYKLMAQLRDNPNIVHCDDFRDVQHDDGLGWDIYIKMELLTPLMKCLDLVSTEKQIIRLGKDICNALMACQEHHIIHRDIKPQNVFISRSGRFKLGDFGIARTMKRTAQATAGIGTYSYMAPEVEKNEPYGCTVDIYSLGLMMYWFLNERRAAFMPLPPEVPKYGDEERARARRFSGEAIPAPKNGSEALKTIVLKACAYDPADRYQTAPEMFEALCALDEHSAEEDATVCAFDGGKYHPTTITSEPAQEDFTATVGPMWNQDQRPAAKPAVPRKKRKWPILGFAAAALVIAIVAFFMVKGNRRTLELSSYSFTDYYDYHEGKGYIHVTPQYWDTVNDRPFWKLPLPDAYLSHEDSDVIWEIVGGDAEINYDTDTDTDEIWIFDIGTVTARATCSYDGEAYDSKEYTVEFNLCKKTKNDNNMMKTPNDMSKENKLCVIPGGGTMMYFTQIEAFPDQYYEGDKRRCLWGKTTYTNYNGWVACSKDDIQLGR